MGLSPPLEEHTQSAFLTCVFIFNLAVGVGVLALPYAINAAGYLFGCVLLLSVCFLAFVSLTFILEAISNTNALIKYEATTHALIDPESQSDDLKNSQTRTLVSKSKIVPSGVGESHPEFFEFRHLEILHLSNYLLPNWGQNILCVIICLCLYGDLSIYSCVVPGTLAKFTGYDYYIFLCGFAGLMIPASFFNFSKTKYLQVLTSLTRTFALSAMIILTLRYIGTTHTSKRIEPVVPSGISIAWGSLNYAFMVHTSIPSVISHMKDKNSAFKVIFFTFSSLAILYTALSLSAIFAFSDADLRECGNSPGEPCKINALYTLNFSSADTEWVAKFITLFPVFTLTTNYPLMEIVLKNNILAIFQKLKIWEHQKRNQSIASSLLAPIPPLLVAFAVRDVSTLVGITGSYGGMCLMFIFPTLFVRISRQRLMQYVGPQGIPKHALRSPFTSPFWEYLILSWAGISLIVITTNFIISAV
eukprot:c18265_g1_i1.p1 GENE.c18265_g1_i1~~c18265_g1_i1.p1  ORF type:complete len:474 (+),score=128.53 c18265_g1_i1:69-1490(+)